jgi:enamine deaminase RidA (YjgF/YER057c/UK114 family)
MIRKVSSEGVGYSVADLNHARYIFISAVPRRGGDLPAQAHDALTTIEDVVREEGCLGSIVHQAVFIRDHDEIEACRRIIEDFYGGDLPATAFVVQPPCQGKLLAIEAWGVCRGQGDLDIERVSGNLVLVRHGGLQWAHCAGIVPQTPAASVYERSISGFHRMRDILASQRFTFDQVIRTWLYLGDIVGSEGDTLRYKELNRARADFYEGIPFLQQQVVVSSPGRVYPASTGIGTSNRDITMGCIALSTARTDLTLVPLENPLQTSAFDYEAAHSPQSPKFSRAMALVGRRTAAVLISGTASITASDTRFVGDIEGQTQQTLDNIEALIARQNFERYGLSGVGATLDDLVLARVYIKRQEDYAQARAICEQRLGELPTIYAVADVCRPELLVEIEGAAFAPIA